MWPLGPRQSRTEMTEKEALKNAQNQWFIRVDTKLATKEQKEKRKLNKASKKY